MSTIPPSARNPDETIVLRDNFTPEGSTVPTGNGWMWIAQAWGLFTKAAGTWIAMVIVLAIIFIVLALIPLLGSAATAVLGPVFTAGLIMASRTLDQGGEAQFGQLFGGFRHRFGALASLGAINLVATIVIVIVAALATGFSPMGMDSGEPDLGRLGLAVLIAAALMLPLLMALWFAPALVAFHDMGALEAMKQSFAGCLKNLLPFLLYGVILLVAAAVASVPIMLGWLVLGPVLAASVYTAYRDIYLSH